MTVFKVVDDCGQVLAETDDWVEAESRSSVENWPKGGSLHIRGTHPTHDWDDRRPRRCRKCDGWDNGSYGSHAPCGYDWSGESLAAALEREIAARRDIRPQGGREGVSHGRRTVQGHRDRHHDRLEAVPQQYEDLALDRDVHP